MPPRTRQRHLEDLVNMGLGPVGHQHHPVGEQQGLIHVVGDHQGGDLGLLADLHQLYVAPATRGSGLGRALIEAVYAAADAAGAPSVYWLTQDFNHSARQLYDRVARVTPFIRYNRVV